MRVQRKHIGASAALLLLGVMLTQGCAENESSLFVRAVLKAPADTCEVAADPSATALVRGTLDTALAAEYHAFFLLGNQLVRRGNTATLRTETSRIQLIEADVEILDANGGSLAAFRVPVSGFVDPGTSTEPGYGVTSAVLIDAATAQSLGQQVATSGLIQEVVASVVLRGHTLGGLDVEAGTFQFPVSICHRCLLTFPGGSDDATVTGPDCCVTTDAPANCRIGMDDLVDCRSCSATNPLCHPTGTATSCTPI